VYRLSGTVSVNGMRADLRTRIAPNDTVETGKDGEIAFVAVKGFLDVRYGARDGAACAEFSWEGTNDGDEAGGRGWVTLGTTGRLVGHIFIHQADDSGFVCERD
jgi:hypothetical protein